MSLESSTDRDKPWRGDLMGSAAQGETEGRCATRGAHARSQLGAGSNHPCLEPAG
jgi:hypothetical protein